LIPFISVFLIYLRRAEVFAKQATPCYAGTLPILIGLAMYGAAEKIGPDSMQVVSPSLSVSIIGFLIACVGGFLFVYGWPPFQAALFPLGFLLLMVPMPSLMLSQIIYALQRGSSDAAAVILRGFGVPFFREGLVFQLPGVAIEVAEQCSGIRSSVALFITTLLAAQLTLRSNWRKLALCALVIPVAIFKNGLRIATISVLSVYVNRDFLYGRLHHSGGFVFFTLGLLVLWGALRLLQLRDSPSVREQNSQIPLAQSTSKSGL
jgi:exosortase